MAHSQVRVFRRALVARLCSSEGLFEAESVLLDATGTRCPTDAAVFMAYSRSGQQQLEQTLNTKR